MTERPRLEHQPALDGLRGIAVAGVIAFHLGHLDGGFLGVDLFFTLSGYLITRLLLIEHDGTGAVDLAGFWKRRAWRLLPALFVVLTAVAVHTWIEARPDELGGIRDGGLASLLYVTNWFFLATGDGYWNLFTTPTPFDHLWSLAIEEQFYVVWPLVFIGLAARAKGKVLAWVTAVATAATGLWMSVGDPAEVYLNTITRSSSVLMGALLGMALHHDRLDLRQHFSRRMSALVALAALVFLARAWITVEGSDDAAFFAGGFFLHSLAVTILILRVTVAPGGPEARLFSLPPLRWLGIVSYGLYLWHWPVIVILDREGTNSDGATLLVIRLVVMAVLTIGSYLLIERPARHDWSRIRHATWALPGAALLTAGLLLLATQQPEARAVVGAIPTTSHAPTTSTEAPVDESEPASTAATTTSTTTTTIAPLVVTTPAPPRLPVPTADEPLRVLLLGDSYLFDAEPGIVAAFDAVPEIDIRTGARFGFAATGDDALDVLTAARDEHRPHVIVAMWARFDAGWLEERDHSDAARAELEDRMVAALDVLTADGAAVAVIGLAPSLGPGVDRVPVDRTINDVFLTATERVDAAFYLDPDPVVAPNGEPERWIETDGGDLLVRKVDVSHYCGDGAARWALALGDLLAQMTGVPPADPAGWWAGEWRDDPRYDDPVGACAP